MGTIDQRRSAPGRENESTTGRRPPRRVSFNTKRKIRHDCGPDEPAMLARRVRCTGDPEHRSDPGDFDLTPRMAPRPYRTPCNEVGINRTKAALNLMKEGIRRGLMSEQQRGGFPQNTWAVTEDGFPLEAQLENQSQGAYRLPRVPRSNYRPIQTQDTGALEPGMSGHFTIRHEWLHGGQDVRPEQATQAGISIWVDETCLTENISRFGEAPRQSACLSSLHLSRWFAGNWWRLLWEPYDGRKSQEWQTAHRAGAAGGGYLWPDLSFSSDWNTILVRSTPTMPSTAEPIHYSREYNGFIPAASFERGIENFVNSTMERLEGLERLTTAAPACRELADLWEEVNRERNDPQSAEWRRLEACLGHDPDDAPDELMEKLFGEYDRYETIAKSDQGPKSTRLSSTPGPE